MKLSLWLLPPEPYCTVLQGEIDELSRRGSSSYPTFLPHVTVVGGFPCDDENGDALRLLERLRRSFRGFGGVPCRFSRHGTTVTTWNQACAATMDRSDCFLRAVRLTRSVLYGDDDDDAPWFAPPLHEPHYSYAYGDDYEVMADMVRTRSPPDEFVAHEAVLMRTWPAALEGVRGWSEVGRIALR